MTLPADLDVRTPAPGDAGAIAALVRACDETYRAWAPPGWEPPPAGRELERWRGRLTDGAWWTRVAVEQHGRVVGVVCFRQAVEATPMRAGEPLRVCPPGGEPAPGWRLEPVPRRAHVAAVFAHPGRWRQGIAGQLLERALEAMRDEGYREAQLWTPREAPARRFYEATGWVHDGREQWLAELGLPIVAYVRPA